MDAVVVEQFLVLRGAHILSPDDIGAVDITSESWSMAGPKKSLVDARTGRVNRR